MHVKDLESLSSRLHQLLNDLRRSGTGNDAPLGVDDPLVAAARDCEFMLPSPLNARTLSETVERKIENVNVLLERARRHESLPEEAQIAADQEYLATEEDLNMERTGRADGAPDQPAAGRRNQ
ncbi:hypothetical protein [Noviherbaspirillum galbum]|uniref:Uncharacterized protein n=1 Tax=Noviherbaspirillum galbum TaxID=2709383 RepID=A0A6B3SWU3_9BURK|nr:hypothetical protein [Noviherbaspirillum galbum]NEX63945.1 hypothetical protein [Noviherbaspirillum galbum]